MFKKSVTDHSKMCSEDDYFNEYFKKGCVFFVVQCGMCKYFIGDTNQTISLVDNEEFCIVITPDVALKEDVMKDIWGKVRATDLQIYRFGNEDED